MKRYAFVLIGLTAFLLAGCEKSDRSVRHYREVSFAEDRPFLGPADLPPGLSNAPVSGVAAAMTDLPPEMRTPPIPLAWTTPAGWEELKGTGMRLVTFKVDGQECTILTFPGDVGGDAANIRRWLGQVGVTVAEDALAAFVAAPEPLSTEGGFPCRLFDFDSLIPDESGKGMLAAIIPVDDHTAFVKLMGQASVVNSQKAAFIALCQSIRKAPAAETTPAPAY